MNIAAPTMVIDVESVGLHGVGFALGAVVLDADSNRCSELELACNPCHLYREPPERLGRWSEEDVMWVGANVLPALGEWNVAHPFALRAQFWAYWLHWQHELPGLQLAADVTWPVETNFLEACVRQYWPASLEHAPYPLIDIASVRQVAGGDPTVAADRREDELPRHNPLRDARHSARLYVESVFALGLYKTVAEIAGRDALASLQARFLGSFERE